MNEYEKQANDFLQKTQTTISTEYLGHYCRKDCYFKDGIKRAQFEVTLRRAEGKVYTFKYTDSMNNSYKSRHTMHNHKIILDDTKELTQPGLPHRNFTFAAMKQMTDGAVQSMEKEEKPVLRKKEFGVGVEVRGGDKWNLQAVVNTPSNYGILACLTKYDPGTFKDFCMDYGYNSDSRKAKKTYNAVKHEYEMLSRMFSEAELRELAEIN